MKRFKSKEAVDARKYLNIAALSELYAKGGYTNVSSMKELYDNAFAAGASNVKTLIDEKRGMILVLDDGSGLDPEKFIAINCPTKRGSDRASAWGLNGVGLNAAASWWSNDPVFVTWSPKIGRPRSQPIKTDLTKPRPASNQELRLIKLMGGDKLKSGSLVILQDIKRPIHDMQELEDVLEPSIARDYFRIVSGRNIFKRKMNFWVKVNEGRFCLVKAVDPLLRNYSSRQGVQILVSNATEKFPLGDGNEADAMYSATYVPHEKIYKKLEKFAPKSRKQKTLVIDVLVDDKKIATLDIREIEGGKGGGHLYGFRGEVRIFTNGNENGECNVIKTFLKEGVEIAESGKRAISRIFSKAFVTCRRLRKGDIALIRGIERRTPDPRTKSTQFVMPSRDGSREKTRRDLLQKRTVINGRAKVFITKNNIHLGPVPRKIRLGKASKLLKLLSGNKRSPLFGIFEALNRAELDLCMEDPKNLKVLESLHEKFSLALLQATE